jgi:hypothetical protein
MAELKYHKLFIHDHINARELSETYISDSPDHGRLFLLIELPKIKLDQQPFIDEIVNQIGTFFDTSNQLDPEILLEEILQELNKLLPELSTTTKIQNWISTLDLVVGIFHKNNIYLAGIGNMNAILMHGNKCTPILEKDIKINPAKVFSNIISGELDAGDVLVVSTDSLFDYISEEKIKQLVTHFTPSGAIIKTRELLESVPDFVSFNSLFIKKITARDVEITPAEIHDQQQLDIDTKESDEEIIVEDRRVPAKTKKTKSTRTKYEVDMTVVKKLGLIKKILYLLGLVALFFKLLSNFFKYIFTKIKNAFLFSTSKQYRDTRETDTLEKLKNNVDGRYSWWQGLKIAQKIAIITFSVIILVFLQSLVFTTQDKADKNKNTTYNETIQLINNKFNEAEASLIYNDEQGSEKILLEIKDLIDNLKANSPEQLDNIAQLKSQVFYDLNKVRHIHVVDNPLEKSNLSTLVTNAQDIVQKDGDFYILGDNKLFKSSEEALEEIFNFAEGQVAQSMTDWPDENKVVLSITNANDENIYTIFDFDENQTAGSLEQTAANTAVQDLAIYSNNLYVLDNDSNQIFKYPEYGNSFSNGQIWITEDVQITGMTSFTIDGEVYIINDQGQIYKFSRGEQDTFGYHQPHPVIGPNSVIKTFPDSDYLYIIDPNNQRVIILDKEGNIKDQYASQKFDNLLDLAIDPEEKAIYLLNGNHLYLLAINE